MISAVQDLQMAIVEGSQPVSQLLRRTKFIAAKLGLKDVEEWVNLELNGYPEGKDVPAYRIVVANGLKILNPYRGWEYAGDTSESIPLTFPICEIEIFSQKAEVGLVVKNKYTIATDLGESKELSQWPQRLMIETTKFHVVIEAVKNNLVEWACELERRGIKGENMNFDEKEKQAAANQIFNIGTVHGTVGNISNSQVTLYDYSSVQKLLIEKNIPKPDRRKFEDILDELKTASLEEKPSLLARAEQWIVEHKDLLGVTVDMLKKVLQP